MPSNHENPSLGGRLARFLRRILDLLRVFTLRAPRAAPERRIAQLTSRYVAEAPRSAEKSEASRDGR